MITHDRIRLIVCEDTMKNRDFNRGFSLKEVDEEVHDKICGMMGVFWGSASGFSLNSTERKLVRMFRRHIKSKT